MARTATTFSTAEKRNLLNSWKGSGLSLPAWHKEYAEELQLPHLSTLYDWCKSLGFTTEPGGTEEATETPDEGGNSTDMNEADEPAETGQPGTETETGQPGGEKEPTSEGDEEVIAKDRITNLEPSTVPDSPKEEAPKETPKGGGIPKELFIIIGGALVLGVGGFLIFKKLKRKPKVQEPATQQAKGGIPFDGGYTTIDQF